MESYLSWRSSGNYWSATSVQRCPQGYLHPGPTERSSAAYSEILLSYFAWGYRRQFELFWPLDSRRLEKSSARTVALSVQQFRQMEGGKVCSVDRAAAQRPSNETNDSPCRTDGGAFTNCIVVRFADAVGRRPPFDPENVYCLWKGIFLCFHQKRLSRSFFPFPCTPSCPHQSIRQPDFVNLCWRPLFVGKARR